MKSPDLGKKKKTNLCLPTYVTGCARFGLVTLSHDTQVTRNEAQGPLIFNMKCVQRVADLNLIFVFEPLDPYSKQYTAFIKARVIRFSMARVQS